MRRVAAMCALAIGVGLAGEVGAQRRGSAPAVRRDTPKTTCPAVAGVGVTTKRRYCEVRIAEIVEDGIRIEIPARTGAATLLFDLHNRYVVSDKVVPSRQDAVVAIVSPEGKIVDRALARGELRTTKDLFDRLRASSGRGSAIATAPGRPQRIRVSVPAGMAFVALVGMRQDVQLPNRFNRYEEAGKQIALASNFEIVYSPRR